MPLPLPLPSIKGRCVQFDSTGGAPNPRSGTGFTLEVLDHDGTPAPVTEVRKQGNATGLDVGRTTLISFGTAMHHVKVTLVHFARPATVAVLDYAGNVLLGKTMTVADGIPEALDFRHAGIHSLEIVALDEQTLLTKLCYSRLPLAWW
jgi:hypothetical protein